MKRDEPRGGGRERGTRSVHVQRERRGTCHRSPKGTRTGRGKLGAIVGRFRAPIPPNPPGCRRLSSRAFFGASFRFLGTGRDSLPSRPAGRRTLRNLAGILRAFSGAVFRRPPARSQPEVNGGDASRAGDPESGRPVNPSHTQRFVTGGTPAKQAPRPHAGRFCGVLRVHFRRVWLEIAPAPGALEGPPRAPGRRLTGREIMFRTLTDGSRGFPAHEKAPLSGR